MKIPNLAKVPIGTVMLLVFWAALTVSVSARQDMPPKFECDCNIEIIGTPELNVPFEVVFTWTPVSDFGNLKGIPDTALLKNDQPNVRYISGDTIWTGSLREGQIYTLKATYEVFEPGFCKFKSIIWAQEAKNVSHRPVGSQGIGIKAFNGCYTKLYNIDKSESATKSNTKWFKTEGDDSVVITPVTNLNLKALGLTETVGKPPSRLNKETQTDETTTDSEDLKVTGHVLVYSLIVIAAIGIATLIYILNRKN